MLIGAVGLPVFSSFTGGLQCISGYTGGYIIGYIPCAFIIGLLTDKFEKAKIIFPVSMAAGTFVCYLSGTLWYMYRAECNFLQAAAVCVLPFIIGDIIKIAAASCIGLTLKQRLKKFI
ncbi:MAG: biotin transporter BioY [Clostridia bacterium]|nr:biotin transporter BioY [Clostridia bacterium]